MRKFQHIGGDKDIVDVLSYTAACRAFLRMQNWDVIVMENVADETDDEIDGASEFPENHYVINLYIGKDWKRLSPSVRAMTILHELVHAQHRDVNILWKACTADNAAVSFDDAHAWNEDYKIQMERFVSWVTMRLRPFAPEWGATSEDTAGVVLQGDE